MEYVNQGVTRCLEVLIRPNVGIPFQGTGIHDSGHTAFSCVNCVKSQKSAHIRHNMRADIVRRELCNVFLEKRQTAAFVVNEEQLFSDESYLNTVTASNMFPSGIRAGN